MSWKRQEWGESFLKVDSASTPYWFVLKTPIGEMVVEPGGDGWGIFYFPTRASDEVCVGTRKTEATAKRFAEAYIRRLANSALEMLK
jgi:hypothetical protein